MHPLIRCLSSSCSHSSTPIATIPSWDTEAYGNYMAMKHPEDEVLERQARNPSALRLQLDKIAREEERIMGSLALFDKFFLPAEPMIYRAVNEQLMEIYRLSQTFRRLFNLWKMTGDGENFLQQWRLMPGENVAAPNNDAVLLQCGLVRDVNGFRQVCYPITGREAHEGRQILLYELVWALMQNPGATDSECWRCAAEYANLIMRELAWPFPSRSSCLSMLVISHYLSCGIASPFAQSYRVGATFPSRAEQAYRKLGAKVMPAQILQWSAIARDERMPRIKMSQYAKQMGLNRAALSRFVGSSGILTNRGKNLLARSAVAMDVKQLASYVRAWLLLPDDERWAAGGQKGYVRARGLTLGRWRHYVDKNDKLTKRGWSLLARTADQQ
ncbi:DUF4765 family protein [Acerihabitans sp. KWT182]|uniref:DUF4765 family protein n=1 Tax=Acerihabitans sp. KWT182 TaxID=3157919 RepID=A0AAU7Q787_9GAMM